MLARLAEHEVRPAFDGETEVDPRRREVDQFARMVEREVLVSALDIEFKILSTIKALPNKCVLTVWNLSHGRKQ